MTVNTGKLSPATGDRLQATGFKFQNLTNFDLKVDFNMSCPVDFL
jgi:hypothetical protein